MKAAREPFLELIDHLQRLTQQVPLQGRQLLHLDLIVPGRRLIGIQAGQLLAQTQFGEQRHRLAQLLREAGFQHPGGGAAACGPARAALYTGQYPARIGFESNIRTEVDGLSSSIPSLPRWLKKAGYRTALFGKWHLGYADDFTPNAHGFDEFIGHHEWTIGYYNHQTETGEPGLYQNGEVVHREGYLTDLLTDEAIDFIGVLVPVAGQVHIFFMGFLQDGGQPLGVVGSQGDQFRQGLLLVFLQILDGHAAGVLDDA